MIAVKRSHSTNRKKMCGIAGIYNFKRGQLFEDYFSKCLDGMRYRGPDDKQLWSNHTNYLAGFVRLSIRDLSNNGRQPMFSACGNYCISFNGEIYNTASLKSKLLPFGIRYTSSTDTEVLLYTIKVLGIEKALALADGIFACAFYDQQQNRLLLARDRTGVKPLYMGVHENGIVYSSQYDHIINHPYSKGNKLDENSIGSYLQMGYVPANTGIVENTKMLKPGHYYTIEAGKINCDQYYRYGSGNQHYDKDRLEETICNAAQSQLVADVPAGSFLSGGIDSTLVTYYANQARQIQSFTIGVKEKAMDEAAAAATFAGLFKTRHACRYITETDLLSLVKDHFRAFSEPFADHSSLPMLLLSAFAKQQVTVALSGDGGDELFWGYPRNIKAASLFPLYAKGKWARRIKLVADKITAPAVTDITRHWGMNNFAGYNYTALQITGAAAWLPEILKSFSKDPGSNITGIVQPAENDLPAAMEAVRKMEMEIHLPRILLKVDRASMFHSLEVRVPFLSNTMLDLSESFRYHDCIEGIQGKMNLKRLLAAKINGSLVHKPKKGFTVPLDNWLKYILYEEVSEKVMDMPAHLAVFFSRKDLQRMLKAYAAGQTDAGWLIWALYCLVGWDDVHRNSITV